MKVDFYHVLQAFIKTAAKILQNIQEGVFDVSNEVNGKSLFLGNCRLLGVGVVTLISGFSRLSHPTHRGVLSLGMGSQL